jgi:hypothetical protein
MKIVLCPVCRAYMMVREGEPPSDRPSNYKNRCLASALSGKPGVGRRGYRFAKSWFLPARTRGKRCNAALTTKTGTILSPLPLAEFIELTRGFFDTALLFQKVADHNSIAIEDLFPVGAPP